MEKYIRIFGILLFIVILANLNLQSVWDSFANANMYVLLGIVVLNILIILIRSWRWIALLQIQGINIDFMPAFWSYFRSLYFGNVTPGRVGELSRAHYLLKYADTNSSTAVSSVIFDRVLDMYLMLVFGFVGFIFSNVWANNHWIKVGFLALMLLLTVVLLFPSVIISCTRCIPNIKNIRNRSQNWLLEFFEGIRCFITFKITFSVILTIIIYFLFFIQCYLLAYSIGLNVNFFYLAFCVVVFSITSLLPISISNLGTREFVLIFMFSYIGLTQESAVCFSLLFFVMINLCLALLGWFAFIFYKDKELEKIVSVKSSP